MVGFVTIQRKILDWEWYQDPVVSRLFIHLILKANFSDKKWQGVLIKRGQLITSYNHLAQDLDLTVQKIRTAILKLKKSETITINPTNKYSLITIVKYDYWQDVNFSNNNQNQSQVTDWKQSKNKQSTTNKQKNNKTIEQRKKEFKSQVFEHTQYSKNILEDFFNYWSEKNWETKMMRFEEDNYFNYETRLKSWITKEKKWKTKTELKINKSFYANR